IEPAIIRAANIKTRKKKIDPRQRFRRTEHTSDGDSSCVIHACSSVVTFEWSARNEQRSGEGRAHRGDQIFAIELRPPAVPERIHQIMRCFPHCCPDHVDRCYCGCSLHLLVTFNDGSLALEEDIVVFARLEALDNGKRAHETGDRLAWPLKTIDSQDDRSMSDRGSITPWMRAERESDIKQRQMGENSILYVLNNNRYPKWFYGYESGATKSQRLMNHQLRAYIFRVEGGLRAKGEHVTQAEIMHIASSPTFTLISYRRARSSRRQHKDDKALIRPVSDQLNNASDTEADQSVSEKRKTKDENNSHHDAVDDNSRRAPLLDIAHCNTRDKTARAPPEDWKNRVTLDRWISLDDLFWVQNHPAIIEKLQHFSIVNVFAQSISLEDCACIDPGLNQKIQDNWLKPILDKFSGGDHQSLPKIRQLSSDVSLNVWLDVSTPSLTSHNLSRFSTTAAAVTALLLWCIGSASFRQLMHKSLEDSCTDGIAPACELRSNFALLVEAVHEKIDRLVQEHCVWGDPAHPRRFSSLSELVDEILTLSHEDNRFEAIRPSLRKMMQFSATQAKSAYHGYVAQVREWYIATVAHRKSKLSLNFRAHEQGTTGYWMVKLSTLQRHVLDASTKSTSIVFALIWIYQVSCIRLDCDEATMVVSSIMPSAWVSTTSQSKMIPRQKLVLDNTLRVCRTMADGFSIMAAAAAGWIVGDYVGMRISPSILAVDVYWIPQPNDKSASLTAARRALIQLEALDEHADTLRISVEIFEGRQRDSTTHVADTSYTDALASLTVRHALYEQCTWWKTERCFVEYTRLR
ncbi:TPA: hypothetical protein N0F65_001000, partial [Lagenidium giganteum]